MNPRVLLAIAMGLALPPACRLAPPGAAPPPRPAPDVAPVPARVGPGIDHHLRLDVRRDVDFTAGWSVEGRPIRYRVHGEGPEVVLVLATLHGDEPAGTPLLERLSRDLAAHPGRLAGRTVVVVVPVANPDGLARATRGNARGVDLNRNYATADFRASRGHGPHPLSEPESRVAAAMVERFAPARVLSVHQPLACVDHDGPARDLAAAMARRTGLPERKLGTRPGSFGSFVGETLGIPILTLELPAEASGETAEALWRRHGDALLGFVAGEPVRGP